VIECIQNVDHSITCRESENEMELSLLPNPSADDFQLQINSAINNVITVNIKDVSGKTCSNFNTSFEHTQFGKELPPEFILWSGKTFRRTID